MTNKNAMPDLTKDGWLGGRLCLTQTAFGFRATTDALILAAAVPQNAMHPIELGAGVGAAVLALAARITDIPITAVELDPLSARLLAQNVADNSFSTRINVITANAHQASPPWQGQHDVVFINPPYNDAASSLSPDSNRRQSMAVDDFSGGLGEWVKSSARALIPKGRLVLISRADQLDALMATLPPCFGDVSLRPIHPSLSRPAKRILLSARKDISGGVTMLPPLVINTDDGGLSDEMTMINIGGGAIEMIPAGRNVAKLRLPHHS